MKKAQTTIIIVLLIIVVVALIVMAYVLLSKPSTIGEVIKETIIKESEVVCNSPYIQVGKECCLDKNSNRICDNEEEITNYVPNQCILSAPLGCNAGTADATGINLEIRNGAGEALDIQSVDVSGCGSYLTATPIADGGLETITVTCTLTAGSKFAGDITVTYKKSGSALDLTSTGKIIDKV